MTKKRKEKTIKLTSSALQKTIREFFLVHSQKRYNAKEIIRHLAIGNNRDSVLYALDQLSGSGFLSRHPENRFGLYTEAASIKASQKDGFQSRAGNAAAHGHQRSSRGKAPARNAQKEAAYTGRVDMTRAGSAFIIVDGREGDIFVPRKFLSGALHNDLVRVAVTGMSGGKAEGRIAAIVERASEQFIGTVRLFRQQAIVIPDRMDLAFEIAVDPTQLQGALNGDKVIVRITDWGGSTGKRLKGVVTMVLGGTGTHDIEMKSILINHGFNILFPDEVMQEAARLSTAITAEEIARRRDFREVTTFTIDPEDAKDFDDAISIRYTEEGHLEVGVHIADVTHYVTPGTALDKEAYLRATSVYLVDRCCPMLPEELSNGLCSLRPKEDKLTFSAVFTFDNDRKIVQKWFGKTLIHSDRRFSYEAAQAVLDSGQGEFAAELKTLNELAGILRKRRTREGAINFEDAEVRFRLDDDGEPVEVYAKERKDAHLLIEDLMLLANREVATFIHHKGKSAEIPFVYRIHDTPNPDKLAEFALFAKEIGFKMDISTPRKIAASFNRLMKAAEENDALKMLEPLAIRTMAKAIYSSGNIGHYGLAFEHYAHFTSPIRRYADVLAHRILEQNLHREWRTDKERLEAQCKHVSLQERKASEAERESIKYYQTVFLEKHVGDTFEGFISGMIEKGVFVTLKENRCEGLVPFDRMNESFDLADSRLRATGRRSGRVLKMGDRVRARILWVDRDARQIEMMLAEENG